MSSLFITNKNLFFRYALVAVVVVILDQVSKISIMSFLHEDKERQILVFKFLNIVHLWNRGMSFGLFGNFQYSNSGFLTLSILIIGFVLYLVVHTNSKMELLSYNLIIGGAIGNIVDRIRHGEVFDFIDLHINQYHWPTFNIADSAIFLGALLLISNIFMMRSRND